MVYYISYSLVTCILIHVHCTVHSLIHPHTHTPTPTYSYSPIIHSAYLWHSHSLLYSLSLSFTYLLLILGAIIYYNSAFGSGYGPIVYSYVNCEGHEDSFTECSKYTYLQFTCYNTDTVGVLCVDGKINYAHIL